MRINNNLMAMNTHRQLGINNANSAKSIAKLSSGLRINSAADDAAGLAISEKMRGQIRGLNQASRNAQDGISMIQTGEGALQETQSILQRMRELAVQASNGTYEDSDREKIQTEMDQLTSEVNRIGNTTEFNQKSLLDGSVGVVDTIGKEVIGTGADQPDYTLNTAGAVSDLALDNDSIDAGKYHVTVTKTSVSKVAGGQVSEITDAEIKTTDATTLAEGSYKAHIEGKTVQSVKSGTISDTDSLLNTDNNNNAITLSSASNLADDNYVIGVTKEVTKTATGANASGISNVDVSAFDDDTRFDVAVNTALNYTAINGTGVGGAATDIYNTDNTNGAIKNLQINGNSTMANADNYAIKVDQLGDTEAKFTANALGAMNTTSNNVNLTIDGNAIDMTAINSHPDAYDGATNIATVVGELQTAINAVYDGSAHNGETFTVTNNGGKIEITSSKDTIGDKFTIAGANLDQLGITAGDSATVTNTSDDVKLRFTLVKDNGGAGETVEQTAEATFTNTAGSKTISLGDVTFDVDQAKVYASDGTKNDATAGDFDTDVIELDADSIKTAVTVTKDGDTANAVTKQYKQDGSDDGVDQAFTFGGKDFEIDIDATNLSPGQTQVTTVDVNTTYSVQLGKDANNDGDIDAGEELGTAHTFTEADLADSANVTNIALGAAGNGMNVDFDTAKLRDLAAGTSNITLDLEAQATFTAKILNADGSDAGQDEVVLNKAGGDDQTIGLGENITLEYDGADLVDNKDIFFSVKTDSENYSAALKKDGASTDMEVVSFNKGEQINFTENGVTLDTTTDVANNDKITFNVKETGEQEDNSVSMQIGANAGQSFNVDINDMRASKLGISSDTKSAELELDTDGDNVTDFKAVYRESESVTNGTEKEYSLDISNHENATAAVEVINRAIEKVSSERSKLGSLQNRLEHTIKNLDTSSENLTSAESRIRDVDMAKEMMEQSKNSILSQAAQAMLAQAKQAPQGVLQLLR